MSSATAALGSSPSWQTRTTASQIGISTPTLRARSVMERQLLTPSAVCLVTRAASSRVAPSPSCSPKVWLRDKGDEQVATRSPSPASPANVVGSAPRRMPRRVVSARPRVMIVAFVLSPMPMPGGHAVSEGDDVLDRAAELTADDVGVRVRAEVRGGDGLLDVDRPAVVDAGDDRGRGLLFGDLAGEVRARQDRDARLAGTRDLGDDLGHALGRAELDALHEAQERRDRFEVLLPDREVAAQRLAGDGQDHEVRAAQRHGRVVSGAHQTRQVDVREVVRVAVGRVDRLGDLGPPGPHGDRRSGIGQDLGEHGSPGTGPMTAALTRKTRFRRIGAAGDRTKGVLPGRGSRRGRRAGPP